MHKLDRYSMRDSDYIVELYHMATKNFPDEKIADWLALNGIRYSNQAVRRTLKKAGREDLIDYFIKEEDINIGDTIRSRMTSRIGKVTSIHKDGDTIEVRWDTGGKQLIGKESVFKMRTSDAVDSADEITKVKSRDVMGYKKLEEFLERNKIKVSNAMKRGVNMKPMKLIATVAIIAIIIITIVYSVKIFQTSDSKNGESGQEDLVIPTTEESVEASSSANIGKFPLPKSSVEETGFKVDKVFLNSRKIYMFSSKEQGTYNFAYVFPSNIQKTDFLICFDLDCVLNSAFHFDKSNLLTQPVTFEAASNSPLNNFQLQTSVIEVLGLIVVSIGEDSFDNDLFPIMKLAVSETDNKDRIEFTAYDVNVV